MPEIKCPCGKVAKFESKFVGSVGSTIRKTGYGAVLSHGGGLIYLCPDCYKKARALAKELFEIIKDDNLSLLWLLEKEEK